MNLFQKYGGAEFWSNILNIFYTRVTSLGLLSRHFIDKDIEYIKSMLIGLLEVTLVVEGHYPEDALIEGHRSMEITSAEFNEWKNIYKIVLNEAKITEEDVDHILGLIDGYRHCIVSKP